MNTQFIIAIALILLSNAIIRLSKTSSMLKGIGYLLLLSNIKGIDLFQDMLILVSTITGMITSLYTMKYSEIKYRDYSVTPLIDLFAISIILVYVANNLLELITFWLSTELIGFVLIAFEYIKNGDRSSFSAAVKYLVFSMIPTDVTLFIILSLTGFENALRLGLFEIRPDLSNPAVSLLVLLGFFSKAAIFPLHFWLPDAHTVAPSPASALLSGVMVKMGIYGIYLTLGSSIDKSVAISTMIFCSAITAVYGCIQASLQKDIKRILAYSTTANTAISILLLSIYLEAREMIFIEASLAQTIAHALYKTTLFLDSGFVESTAGTRDVNKLGYIFKWFPVETTLVLTTMLGAIGMPPSMGFFSKVLMFTSVGKYLTSSSIFGLAFLVILLYTVLAIIYNLAYMRAHVNPAGAYVSVNMDNRARPLVNYVLMSTITMFIMPFTLITLRPGGYIEPLIVEKSVLILIFSLVIILVVAVILKELLEMRQK